MRLVHELVNGAGLTPGSGASGGGRIMGAEAGVHHKLAEVGWLHSGDFLDCDAERDALIANW